MSKLQVFTVKGAKSGEAEFPKEMAVELNADLMAQAFHVFEGRSHKNTSRVKTRAEVNLTTRKIYRQKGTGGARHGSKKAPIFVGGGVAHGPKGIKRTLKISKKLSSIALKMFLAQKVKNKAVCFVTGIAGISKTKDASEMLKNVCKNMEKKTLNNVMLVLDKNKKDVYKYFRNIEGLNLSYWNDLNLRSVYLTKLIVFDNDIFAPAKKENKEKLKKLKVEKKTIKKSK